MHYVQAAAAAAAAHRTHDRQQHCSDTFISHMSLLLQGISCICTLIPHVINVLAGQSWGSLQSFHFFSVVLVLPPLAPGAPLVLAVSIKPTCCVDASRAGPAHQTGCDPHAKSLLLSGQSSPVVHSSCLVMHLTVGVSGLFSPSNSVAFKFCSNWFWQ